MISSLTSAIEDAPENSEMSPTVMLESVVPNKCANVDGRQELITTTNSHERAKISDPAAAMSQFLKSKALRMEGH